MSNYKPSLLSPKSRLIHLAIALTVFYVLYTLINSYSSYLYIVNPGKVHVLATSIDSTIRFIPAMIVPYSWSLLLFCISFFLVQTPKQLTLLTRRLVIATILACIIFYVYPARFSFDRPITEDWTQLGYKFLSITDKPFNQFPSLHVSYALLLGVSLWPATDRSEAKSNKSHCIITISYRIALVVVCALITISTVFTYQHHVLDILGGIVLAGIAFYMANHLRSDLVLKYLVVAIAGFIIIAISGFLIQRVFDYPSLEYLFIAVASYWLLSFLLVTWLYQFPNVNRNRRCFVKDEQGQLTLGTWFRFAPLLATYKAMSTLRPLLDNHKHNSQAKFTSSPRLPLEKGERKEPSLDNFYCIKADVYTVATPKLRVADVELLIQGLQAYCTEQRAKDNSEVYRIGLDAIHSAIKTTGQQFNIIIVDVSSELSSHYPAVKTAVDKCRNQAVNITEQRNYSVQYVYLPLLDLQSLAELEVDKLLQFFQKLDQLITSDSKHIKTKSSSITLINFHCVMGLSRSIAIQTLYLLYCGKLNVDSYQSWLQDYYPQAHISAEFMPTPIVTEIIRKGRLADTLISKQ